MNIYKLLKLNNAIKSHRIKFFGLWLLNVLNKRFLSIQLDPVLACNLKCKMCYFSDPEYIRNKPKGMFKEEELAQISNAVFKNALKLQIGCGTEPTLFKYNVKLISLAKQHQVPFISMVTNGNLLSEQDINDFTRAGLDEFILSMHGVAETTYEEFMTNGNYKKFVEVIKNISDAKKIYKHLKLRINYTFNVDNFNELKTFFDVFGNFNIDVLQLRPIDKIGNTAYNNFNLKEIEKEYKTLINYMKVEAKKRQMALICPESIERNENVSLIVKTKNNSSYLKPYTYCYVSPSSFWKEDFDWKNETYRQWKRRTGWQNKIFNNIFISLDKLDVPNRNMLNYEINS
jgi:MoaA/NifB/PqqE/SkfB family radical SAM enzyme